MSSRLEITDSNIVSKTDNNSVSKTGNQTMSARLDIRQCQQDCQEDRKSDNTSKTVNNPTLTAGVSAREEVNDGATKRGSYCPPGSSSTIPSVTTPGSARAFVRARVLMKAATAH